VRAEWPAPLAWLGVALLFGGVLLALRRHGASLPAQGPT
jgi:drug/metabolite transporter (DMT)-like permease